MSVQDILTRFGSNAFQWGTIAILIVLSLVQIAPVKLNPWDSIFAWLGKKLNGKELSELKNQVTAMWVNSHRQHILTFARELRGGITHSTDEWSNTLALIDEYENYCSQNHVANGVVKADSRFINDMYQQLSREHKL